MRRRRVAAMQMAPLVETPTGNVRLTLPLPALAGDDRLLTSETVSAPKVTIDLVAAAGAGGASVGAVAEPTVTAVTDPTVGTTTIAAAPGWSIRDGDGHIVASGLASRAAALRTIGVVAMRERCAPYEVLDPAGRPTGDRLS
jgi:hypothetical protein